ncbi:protein MpMIR160 [Marchantia polymorpha subsp. ruderalis]|uniref:Uncharacterized protein n=2 Tax=Marchantia polymorpha TaxID=3197 RepID=A0AAF6AUL0_MARPO|nr:hypothetical protein MARPO_0002s0211 [Marchantia polymorpha]BBN00131.1 hypothetical protein Mp_1g26670 [Marchantia polymorpha subsp. ruderalis]|eukprot:PTQ49753.1 hypothetical protein MARPO_0002s0211 [Marchantia polymorpha]
MPTEELLRDLDRLRSWHSGGHAGEVATSRKDVSRSVSVLQLVEYTKMKLSEARSSSLSDVLHWHRPILAKQQAIVRRVYTQICRSTSLLHIRLIQAELSKRQHQIKSCSCKMVHFCEGCGFPCEV